MKDNSSESINNKVVDVIIPVYNPGDEFDELIRRLQKQDKDINKISIIHTRDGKDITELAKRYNNIVIREIEPDQFDHGGTRDEGIRGSLADVVVCMTQDAIPQNSKLISTLLEALCDEKVGVAYARQLPAPQSDIIEYYTRQFNYPNKSQKKSQEDIAKLGIKTYFCSNVCAAYKTEIYVELGGFEKKTIFNEDMIFASKIVNGGYTIAYEAEAKVVHSHNYSCLEQFKRNFDLGVSQKVNERMFRDIKSEKEGLMLIKQTMKNLLKAKHLFAILRLIVLSVVKYLGYSMGKNYKILPQCIINKFTMNPAFWRGEKIESMSFHN